MVIVGIIVLVFVFLMVGAGINGVNKAKSAAYLAAKYDEQKRNSKI